MNFLYAHICYFTIIIFSSNPQIIIDYINLYKFITFGEVKIKIEMKVMTPEKTAMKWRRQ